MTAYCVSLMFLAGLSAEDIKEKKISVYYVLIFALSGIVFRVFTQFLWNEILWNEISWSFFPGSVLLLLAFLTKEDIGYGDGMCVLALGLWTGGWFALTVMCIGIMLAGIWGMVCIFRRKRETIPFVPFLLLGMEVALVYA
ncbi:MAG: prepilin peptidase [Lachnospiraceae bacterium]|nr:prepilin peptidase [Lachnospiraceae bacterium]MDE7285254.1 prepilin peptidase [Lachnospiraceae bacterium]